MMYTVIFKNCEHTLCEGVYATPEEAAARIGSRMADSLRNWKKYGFSRRSRSDFVKIADDASWTWSFTVEEPRYGDRFKETWYMFAVPEKEDEIKAVNDIISSGLPFLS